MVTASRLRTSVATFGLICVVCAGQPASSQDQAKTEVAPAAKAAPANADLVAAIDQGRQQYLANCRTCHGSNGTAGVPLARNEKVSAGVDYLVWAILTGPGYMPEFGPTLSDEQIAQISTFVLNSWGNSYGIVKPDDIKALR
jgi:mono/diheme cytochrome c family protein